MNIHRYLSRKSRVGRDLGLDPIFRNGLFIDFNLRINKDVVVIIIIH